MPRSRVAPAFESWSSYRTFAAGVRSQRRFAQDAESSRFLAAVRNTSQQRARILRKGNTFCRAQIGYALEPADPPEPGWHVVPAPHPRERMLPDPTHVGDGRANPRGIAYLYLSDRAETAIAETRPWVGALVSVAVFEILRDLKLVDCTRGHTSLAQQREPPKHSRWDAIVWQDIDRAFARPVDPADMVAYVPTQILTEVFRDEGYDGVCYRSALGSDRNFLLFDVSATRQILCQLQLIRGVKYRASRPLSAYGESRATKDPPGDWKRHRVHKK